MPALGPVAIARSAAALAPRVDTVAPYTPDTMAPVLRGWVMGIAVTVVVCCLLVLLANRHRLYKSRAVWITSIAISVILTAGIVAGWVVVALMPAALNVGAPLLQQSTVEGALDGPQATEASRGQTPTMLVPTGVYIRTLQFVGSHNLAVTGVVWQKYPRGAPAGLNYGVEFPDATSVTTTEVSRTAEDAYELIHWNFSATVREQFIYSSYPLDRQDLWLRMRPAETQIPVALTPDLASYLTLAPTAKPGLEPDIVLEGWYPAQSYFSFAPSAANVTFRQQRVAQTNAYPELYYTVTIKRDLFVPFMTYLFPVLITAIVLFFGLLIATKELERRTQIGWSVTSILSYSATLLFVVLLAHINMRSVVGAEGLLYLGYFYFALYGLIMLVLLNALLLVSKTSWRFITHGDNLYPKALYWPLYLGVIFVVTLLTFYI